MPGKKLETADTLSRSPVDATTAKDDTLQQEIENWVNQVIRQLPVTHKRLEQMRQMQKHDPIFQQTRNFVRHGWPEYEINGELKIYMQVAPELTNSR